MHICTSIDVVRYIYVDVHAMTISTYIYIYWHIYIDMYAPMVETEIK